VKLDRPSDETTETNDMTDDLETPLSDDERARYRDLVVSKVRNVPDFPKAGILFRDITPILADGAAMRAALRLHLDAVWKQRHEIDLVVGMESRGFLFGMALAGQLGCGFVPARKPGKLPAKTIEERYALEYGQDVLQMHADAIAPGQKVLVVDDLLATGGTAAAACGLVKQLGGDVVACVFLIELAMLRGADKLDGVPHQSILVYD